MYKYVCLSIFEHCSHIAITAVLCYAIFKFAQHKPSCNAHSLGWNTQNELHHFYRKRSRSKHQVYSKRLHNSGAHSPLSVYLSVFVQHIYMAFRHICIYLIMIEYARTNHIGCWWREKANYYHYGQKKPQHYFATYMVADQNRVRWFLNVWQKTMR